jgi:hypothetical protein
MMIDFISPNMTNKITVWVPCKQFELTPVTSEGKNE